jgi:hypothetical protein
VSEIQRESQAVLDSIEENHFHGAFEAWKKKKKNQNNRISVYITKEIAAKIKLSQHFFFWASLETFRYTSY